MQVTEQTTALMKSNTKKGFPKRVVNFVLLQIQLIKVFKILILETKP